MLGALLLAASVAMPHVTKHPPLPPAHLARMGLYVVAAGAAFGLVVLVIFAFGRRGNAGKPRPGPAPAGHRREAARGQSPAPPGPAGAAGPDPAGHGRDQDRGRAAAAGDRHAGRGGARSGRPPVLNPTNVYTPGGLIGAPRDGHAPAAPDGQPIPEILRTADQVPRGFASAGPGQGAPFPGAPFPGAAGQGRHGP